jgi:hypothetical protein
MTPAAPSMAQRAFCSSACTILHNRQRNVNNSPIGPRKQPKPQQLLAMNTAALQRLMCAKLQGANLAQTETLIGRIALTQCTHHFMDSSSLAARYRGSKP